MLGRAFAVRGTIARGERRGQGLGWPTINLIPNQEVIPARGVYVSEVGIADEPLSRQAVTNVGVRPTVSAGGDLVVESHIFDFSADVYGLAAEVSFIERLRDEETFNSLEALTEQIRLDARRAREIFAGRPDRG
jgi:riboflavin kinase/FMN adenylyltransferase